MVDSTNKNKESLRKKERIMNFDFLNAIAISGDPKEVVSFQSGDYLNELTLEEVMMFFQNEIKGLHVQPISTVSEIQTYLSSEAGYYLDFTLVSLDDRQLILRLIAPFEFPTFFNVTDVDQYRLWTTGLESFPMFLTEHNPISTFQFFAFEYEKMMWILQSNDRDLFLQASLATMRAYRGQFKPEMSEEKKETLCRQAYEDVLNTPTPELAKRLYAVMDVHRQKHPDQNRSYLVFVETNGEFQMFGKMLSAYLLFYSMMFLSMADLTQTELEQFIQLANFYHYEDETLDEFARSTHVLCS